MRFSARNWRIGNGLWHIVFAFALFAICYLLFAITPVHAQVSVTTVGSPPSASQYAPNLNPDIPRDQHSYIQSVMIETMSAMVCQLSGIDMVRSGQECLGVDSKTGRIGFTENGGGAIGVIGTFIAYTFTPPVSSGDYVRYLAGNFGIVKNTYAQTSPCAGAAQGVGFCGIQPLLKVWVAMRNIAYLLFVLIFVIIGLAIMLRVHIDPRTVMSIENQIPRIIVGILLVTFSFAIAGFLIDVMYISIYLVGGVLSSIPGHAIGVPFSDIATSPTPFDAINRLWPGDGTDDFGSAVGGGFPELALRGSDTIRNLVISALNGNPVDGTRLNLTSTFSIADILTNVLTFVAGLIVGLLAALIIFIALIYTAIRLWIILIVAYINVLLDVVFAPFWILIGLFPGSSLGVGAWFKDMLANLAVFPTALSMFVLGKIFSNIAAATVPAGEVSPLFIPPLVGGGTGAGSEIFAGIVALGFLFMTPHVLQITRSAIKAPAINYGPVFQPVGAAGGTLGAGASSYMAYSQRTPMPGEKGGRQAIFRKIFKY